MKRLLILAPLLLNLPVRAVDYVWNAGSANWSTTGNWTPASGAGGPNSGDAAIIRNGGTVTYDAGANASVNRLLVGRDGTGTLNMSTGSRTVNSYLFFGAAYNQNSSGTLNMTGGTLTVNGGWQHWGVAQNYSGESTGPQANVSGTAVLNVNGGVLHVTDGGQRTHLGWTEGGANSGSGSGTLNLSAGTVTLWPGRPPSAMTKTAPATAPHAARLCRPAAPSIPAVGWWWGTTARKEPGRTTFPAVR
jgi:hypothetical protein